LIGSIFCFFYRKFRVFPVFLVDYVFFLGFFGLFRNRLLRLFPFYTETESFDVLIEPKQTENPPKQFKREYIWVFFRKFRVVSVCFCLLRNSSVCFGCFDIDSKHRNKPKYFVFGFTKQTETNAKQILFRFVSVRTEIYFCLFQGHPIPAVRIILYLEYHRICSLVRIGAVYALPSKRVCPPGSKEGGSTRLRVRGWADPIQTTREKAWHSVVPDSQALVVARPMSKQRHNSAQNATEKTGRNF
jgi:hypothetical protein